MSAIFKLAYIVGKRTVINGRLLVNTKGKISPQLAHVGNFQSYPMSVNSIYHNLLQFYEPHLMAAYSLIAVFRSRHFNQCRQFSNSYKLSEKEPFLMAAYSLIAGNRSRLNYSISALFKIL